MRLDKFISNNTDLTRSIIKRFAKDGLISVNGKVTKDTSIHISDLDTILVRGTEIRPVGKAYYMFNKPSGIVCANSDGEHLTVIDLVAEQELQSYEKNTQAPSPYDLQIAGRLDLDTTGLVLLTNDGDWNHKVTSPNFSCLKCYHVELEQDISDEVKQFFTDGILLEGEKKKTKPASLTIEAPRKVLLEISEGKYHQVKRMFSAVGNKVVKLHRQSIGEIQLDPELPEGKLRRLTLEEVNSVYALKNQSDNNTGSNK
ncbi:pseudouridine synthase [Teredinibacter sp. KSP-S5-2]|uniref:pseudouridine synthase n=1 Tax=Teredinibacter sp. KSP-S5-2 TaxID=3034506 RepID=UPI0029342C5C|nr:pseudouridine synthase [Teredinibacter sp. KSP-S5-2]WNO11057.1 pseudouridine synthase [Teredinibacter sp. KSP-S5-2]